MSLDRHGRTNLIVLVFISACGTKSAPVAMRRPVAEHEAKPVAEPKAIKICDGWQALAERCPDLDPVTPYDVCTRTYTAAFAYAKTTTDADEIGQCVLGTGACTEVAACLEATNPSGLYAVASSDIDADCNSRAPGKRSAHPLLGKPAPALAALVALRGSPVLVTFTASWEATAAHELRLLEKLATKARVLVVLSNTQAEVDAVAAPALQFVADVPRNGETLGPITQQWQVNAVPESFLVDATNVVRRHFVRMHEWASDEAAACVRGR